MQLIEEQPNLFARHPQTTFIAAHLGWLGHDLGKLGALLDRLPNVYAEIVAITSELGRQPRAAHRFFVKYQDRILFGKDRYDVEEYHLYFRLLETDDEYFDPIRKYHGIWKLYGLALPDDVLKKLYYKNALRIFPGLPAAGFPQGPANPLAAWAGGWAHVSRVNPAAARGRALRSGAPLARLFGTEASTPGRIVARVGSRRRSLA